MTRARQTGQSLGIILHAIGRALEGNELVVKVYDHIPPTQKSQESFMNYINSVITQLKLEGLKTSMDNSTGAIIIEYNPMVYAELRELKMLGN